MTPTTTASVDTLIRGLDELLPGPRDAGASGQRDTDDDPR